MNRDSQAWSWQIKLLAENLGNIKPCIVKSRMIKKQYKKLNQYIYILFNTKLRFQNSHSFLYFLVAANIKPRCCKWNWLGWEWITGRLANNHIHSCWIKPHLKTFDNHIHRFMIGNHVHLFSSLN